MGPAGWVCIGMVRGESLGKIQEENNQRLTIYYFINDLLFASLRIDICQFPRFYKNKKCLNSFPPYLGC